MSELLDGYRFYKSVQGKKYTQGMDEIKVPLSKFRLNLGKFTDKIFVEKNEFISLKNGKGNWLKTNGTTISEYIWNRYKPQNDNSTLVIYFKASAKENEGLFVSIGLIDDKLTDFEKENYEKIYAYLQKGCKKIASRGFVRKNIESGERFFSIEDEQNFEMLDYSDLLSKLKNLYFETYDKFYTQSPQDHKMIENTNKSNDTRPPLNQILYGPPGTGKTYHTINKAIEIIDNDFFQAHKEETPENRKALKDKFEEYKKSGQIEFVTFHQSYGYEEFIEGIKAIPAGEEGNEDGTEMIYRTVLGTFQKLAIVAKRNYELSKQTDLDINTKFDILWKKLKDFLVNEIDEREKYFLSEQVYVFEVQDKRLKYKGDNWLRHDRGLNLKYENIKAMYLARVKERKSIKDMDSIESLAKQHATYNLAILDKIYDLEKSIKFEKEPRKNYILIIDEINRGNISKIFGELITLIESSKRIGADEALHVKLPYSGEPFGVPSNLYIIGTMNTADRSIALMDTALRRRFDFEEMMPRPELLDFTVDGLHVKRMLETINKRIEYLYDREHTIGHAYFMSLKTKNSDELKTELDNIFKNKIIPLLQEYFYDDWEKIMMVLGDGFIEKREIKSDIFDDKYRNTEYIEEEKLTYVIKESFDYGAF